jgi:hypothetical protein
MVKKRVSKPVEPRDEVIERLLTDAFLLTMKVPRQAITASEYFERMERLVEKYKDRRDANEKD